MYLISSKNNSFDAESLQGFTPFFFLNSFMGLYMGDYRGIFLGEQF